MDNAIPGVAGAGNCRWSRLGFSHDQHPARPGPRPHPTCGTWTRRRCWTRSSPPAAPRTRRRPGCWRWRCTGSTCTRSPPSTRPRRSRPSGPVGSLARWVRRSSTGPRWPGPGRRRWPSTRSRSSPPRLNLSHAAGLSLVSEAVELCYRLPRLWALVQDGRLQAWKARQVARATTQLSPEAVAFVDRHLAVTARSNRIPVLNPVLHEARLRCDPDQAAAVEQNALDHRGVWLDHRESTATTLLTARLDTLDALDLDGTVSDLAGPAGPARRPPGPGRPPGLRARDAGAPATRPRPRRRHRHRATGRRPTRDQTGPG